MHPATFNNLYFALINHPPIPKLNGNRNKKRDEYCPLLWPSCRVYHSRRSSTSCCICALKSRWEIALSQASMIKRINGVVTDVILINAEYSLTLAPFRHHNSVNARLRDANIAWTLKYGWYPITKRDTGWATKVVSRKILLYHWWISLIHDDLYY